MQISPIPYSVKFEKNNLSDSVEKLKEIGRRNPPPFFFVVKWLIPYTIVFKIRPIIVLSLSGP